ncbi:hypothetical protein CSX00_02355 [Pseudobutyrivibrio ruminis]|uniref:Uncharacterized protein n=1 Tax=Pseudobutyrivibrio ruminis TaxID=46206 RepID=A0A2G3EDF6_9FIRM|nr:hypothetical protein [Pseudobutyrivibrio ruminis]PHU41175.1 hypothetical protein CSX00_02355 [Pseudobutyrivibrio ruminis]
MKKKITFILISVCLVLTSCRNHPSTSSKSTSTAAPKTDVGTPLQSENQITFLDSICGTYYTEPFWDKDHIYGFQITKTGNGTYLFTRKDLTKKEQILWSCNQDSINCIDNNQILISPKKDENYLLDFDYYSFSLHSYNPNTLEVIAQIGDIYLKESSDAERSNCNYCSINQNACVAFFQKYGGKYLLKPNTTDCGSLELSIDENNDFFINIDFPKLEEDLCFTNDNIAFVNRDNIYLIDKESSSYSYYMISFRDDSFYDLLKYNNSYFNGEYDLIASGEKCSTQSNVTDNTSAILEARTFFEKYEGYYDDLAIDLHCIDISPVDYESVENEDYKIVGNGFWPVYSYECIKVDKSNDGTTSYFFYQQYEEDFLNGYIKIVLDDTYITVYSGDSIDTCDEVIGKLNHTIPLE